MTDQTVSDVVGANVRSLRRRNEWTVADLAARCARIGAENLTAAAITNIELGRRDKYGNRRRDISVDELTALAAAFSVPPVVLMPELEEGVLDTYIDFGLDDMIARLESLKKWALLREPPAENSTAIRHPRLRLPFNPPPADDRES